MSTNITVLDRIKRSLINTARTDPFYATILFNLELVCRETYPTMATDGKRLYYNTDFVNSCTERMLDVVVLHEATHVAFDHCRLTRHQDTERINVAAELVVNGTIYDRIKVDLAKMLADNELIVPGHGTYKDLPRLKNLDWYYDQLKPSNQKDSSGGVDGANRSDANGDGGSSHIDSGTGTDAVSASSTQIPSARPDKGESKASRVISNPTGTADSPAKGTGDGSPAKGTGDGSTTGKLERLGTVLPYSYDEGETPVEAQHKYEALISQAERNAIDAGNMPGYLQELCGKLAGVSLPWKTLLRMYLLKSIRSGRSFKRPNRRYIYRADIVPSRITKGLGKLLLFVDTSGSMGVEELNQALTACIDIGKAYSNFKLGIIQFDAKITEVTWFDRYSASTNYFNNWVWKGRGGTLYKPVFDKLKDLKADICVIVTDGYPCDPWPNIANCNIPIIWLITKKVNIPVHIKKYSVVINLKD